MNPITVYMARKNRFGFLLYGLILLVLCWCILNFNDSPDDYARAIAFELLLMSWIPISFHRGYGWQNWYLRKYTNPLLPIYALWGSWVVPLMLLTVVNGGISLPGFSWVIELRLMLSVALVVLIIIFCLLWVSGLARRPTDE